MKIIQIGVGGFGGCWLPVIKKNPHVEMVALVDLNQDALDNACEKHDYRPEICSTDLTATLAAVKADLAVVVTPPAFHREPVVQCLTAGLDVISEKPMAETPEDCNAMMKAAADNGRHYVVSQNYRYNPAFYTMARMIREGAIGTVGQVKIDFYKGVNFGEEDFRHKMDYPVLVDMSIHHFDLIRFVTGQDAVSVSGASWNPAWSNYAGDCSSTALFIMNQGARVLYNASWCCKGDFTDWNGKWQVEGDQGTLLYDHGTVTHIPVEGLYKPGEPIEVELDAMDLVAQHWVLENVRTSLAAGTTPATDSSDNIKSVGMVFAAVEATRTGDQITL